MNLVLLPFNKIQPTNAFEAVPEELECSADRQVKALRNGMKLSGRACSGDEYW